MSTTGISCREVAESLTDYLEGTLEASETARLEAHLSSCEGCSNALAQFRLTLEVAGRITEDDVTGPERESIREAFRRWRAERGD